MKYVELENKRKKNERWGNFLDAIYSDPQSGVDKHKRQKYIETIQPEVSRKRLKMETDKSQLEQIKEQQEKKRAERAEQSEQGG